MHTHLNFVFKRALHFSTSVIKLFDSGTKLKLLTQHHEPVSFKYFATCTTHLLLKPMHSVLLVIKGG